jgi:hypothetical protein
MPTLIVLILSVALVAPALAWDDDGYYDGDGFIITGKAAFPG